MNDGIKDNNTRRLWLHLLLFFITLLTTTVAGAWQADADFLADPRQLISGLPFAITLMSILLVHEMGHYLTSRHHGVKATLPYFIPAPSFIGTFGAFIRMQSSPPDRKSLFDVAAAGPLAGLILAVPAVVVGFHLSTVAPQDSSGGGMVLGSSLLLSLISKITLGILPDDANIVLHPIGFAGWIGLLVTAMNLLPAGQLDGGHVTYALFGKRYIWVSRLTVLAILTLGITRMWDGWLVWGVLLLFMGVRHPPPVDPDTPLDAKRKFLGWFLLATLAVTFTPVPFSFQEPAAREERRAPETPETLQRTKRREVFDERTIELAPVLHDDHAPGGGALHL
jgi:membrane-associated protease RseP (regulator of RpoE activity)